MAAIATTSTEITVARALVESAGRVLLVRRSAWDSMPGLWELPGGKIDGDEPVLEGLARELDEETGLMLAGADLLSTRELISPRGRSVREFVYTVSVVGAVALSHEHDDFIWAAAPHEFALTDAATAAFTCSQR